MRGLAPAADPSRAVMVWLLSCAVGTRAPTEAPADLRELPDVPAWQAECWLGLTAACEQGLKLLGTSPVAKRRAEHARWGACLLGDRAACLTCADTPQCGSVQEAASEHGCRLGDPELCARALPRLQAAPDERLREVARAACAAGYDPACAIDVPIRRMRVLPITGRSSATAWHHGQIYALGGWLYAWNGVDAPVTARWATSDRAQLHLLQVVDGVPRGLVRVDREPRRFEPWPRLGLWRADGGVTWVEGKEKLCDPIVSFDGGLLAQLAERGACGHRTALAWVDWDGAVRDRLPWPPTPAANLGDLAVTPRHVALVMADGTIWARPREGDAAWTQIPGAATGVGAGGDTLFLVHYPRWDARPSWQIVRHVDGVYAQVDASEPPLEDDHRMARPGYTEPETYADAVSADGAWVVAEGDLRRAEDGAVVLADVGVTVTAIGAGDTTLFGWLSAVHFGAVAPAPIPPPVVAELYDPGPPAEEPPPRPPPPPPPPLLGTWRLRAPTEPAAFAGWDVTEAGRAPGRIEVPPGTVQHLRGASGEDEVRELAEGGLVEITAPVWFELPGSGFAWFGSSRAPQYSNAEGRVYEHRGGSWAPISSGVIRTCAVWEGGEPATGILLSGDGSAWTDASGCAWLAPTQPCGDRQEVSGPSRQAVGRWDGSAKVCRVTIGTATVHLTAPPAGGGLWARHRGRVYSATRTLNAPTEFAGPDGTGSLSGTWEVVWLDADGRTSAHVFDVAPGAEVTFAPDWAPPGRVEGVVLAPDGARAAGATVRASPHRWPSPAPEVRPATSRIPEDGWTATADAEGRYRIDGLPPGEAVIEARDPATSLFGATVATVSAGSEVRAAPIVTDGRAPDPRGVSMGRDCTVVRPGGPLHPAGATVVRMDGAPTRGWSGARCERALREARAPLTLDVEARLVTTTVVQPPTPRCALSEALEVVCE